jgi:hypothetical protein
MATLFFQSLTPNTWSNPQFCLFSQTRWFRPLLTTSTATVVQATIIFWLYDCSSSLPDLPDPILPTPPPVYSQLNSKSDPLKHTSQIMSLLCLEQPLHINVSESQSPFSCPLCPHGLVSAASLTSFFSRSLTPASWPLCWTWTTLGKTSS